MWERVFVIAEAGVNHNGDLGLAFDLIDVAAEAGADAVKFQTFDPGLLATAAASKAAYQAAATGEGESQLDMLRRLALGADDFVALDRRCRERGIRFMSTAFDPASFDLLAGFDMPAVKIPSGDVTDAPMLLRAARLRRPMIVSTGMATLGEIETALSIIAHGLTRDDEPTGRDDFAAAYFDPEARRALARHVTLLHCVTDYPAAPGIVNLKAMDTLAAAFGLTVGYSDHTLGTAVAVAAVARGARVIEKHFTLDRAMDGPDHAASLEPGELADLVRSIRAVEAALGDGAKVPSAPEIANRAIVRRSLVAARPIAAGTRLAAADIIAKRPAGGRPPIDLWDLVGTVAERDYDSDELL